MPTIFQDRAGISLFDAQYDAAGNKQAIPLQTISQVIYATQRFKRTCQDFSVPARNIRVLATEATRVAKNSEEFRAAIKQNLGWDVEMLPKEEEGRVGALGVASSITGIDGLVMDLGGGSVQMTWLHNDGGAVTVGEAGSISLPYGAAALMRRLDAAQAQGQDAVDELAAEMQTRFKQAFKQISSGSSHNLASSEFPLFLSGGGFRGWGSVLMDTHPSSPYPIPVMNGFCVPASSFRDTSAVSLHVSTAESIFRISTRRAGQIPAVAFLITNLTAALPAISTVRFCQGGVREGALFSTFSAEVRAQIPLTIATTPFAPPSALQALKLLQTAIPTSSSDSPSSLSPPKLVHTILPAFANLLNHESSLPKDVRPATALRSTTTGLLAGAHGLMHEERAALSLALCERWGGEDDLSAAEQDFFGRMSGILQPREQWWAKFLGRIGSLVGSMWPAGVGVAGVEHEEERVRLDVRWSEGLRGVEGLVVIISAKDNVEVDAQAKKLESLGKKKNWIGGKDGWGVKVEVAITKL